MKNRQPPNKPSKFLEKIVDNTVGLIVAFVFSTALLGGSAYLLFEAPLESDKLDREIAEMGNMFAEENRATQMISIINAGWILNVANMEQLGSINQTLIDNATSLTLTQSFADAAYTFCTTSTLQLTDERGQIKGFVFEKPLLREHQATQIKNYDAIIGVLNGIMDTLVNWSQDTLEARLSRYDKITAHFLESKEAIAGIQAQFTQILAAHPLTLEELDQRRNELMTKISLWQTRSILSMIGIIVGISILIALVVMLVSRSLHKSTPGKSSRPRSTK